MIETDISVSPLLVNGTGPYPFAFPADQASDLDVLITTADTVITLNPTTDYIATFYGGADNGGTITLAADIAQTYDGAQLRVLRNVGAEQGWLGQTAREVGLSKSLNRLAMAIQDAARRAAGSIRIQGKLGPLPAPAINQPLIGDGQGGVKWGLAIDLPAIYAAGQVATAARDLAKKWASAPEDEEVEPGLFSALHHALHAGRDAATAVDRATVATAAAAAALASANLFETQAAGLAVTAEGGYFATIGPDADTYAVLYRVVGGAAVQQREVPSKDLVDGKVDASAIAAVALSGLLQDLTEGPDAKIMTAAERAKLTRLSVLNPIDLDDLRARVASIGNALQFRGAWNPTGGVFPGGGTAQAGWVYRVTASGTVDGITFDTGDNIIALVDNAPTNSYADNWLKEDFTDNVLSVNGQTGAITLTAANIAETGTRKWMTDGERNKVGRLSVTFPVDLDAMRQRQQVLDAALVLRSAWSPQGGVFPGSGTAQKGDTYRVTADGVVDGVTFRRDDQIFALVDNAATNTYADNWQTIRNNLTREDLAVDQTDNTPDINKPVSTPQQAAFDARTVNPAILPTGGGVDVPMVMDADGRVYAMRHSDGSVTVSDMRVTPSTDRMAMLFGGFRSLAFDNAGQLSGVMGPHCLTTGLRKMQPPGFARSGQRTNIRRSGQWWQYECNGQTVDVFDTGDEWAPHLPRTQCLRVDGKFGQSWQTRVALASEILDPVLRGHVQSFIGTLVTVRTNTPWEDNAPWPWSRYPYRRGYNTKDRPGGGAVDGFRAWSPNESFTVGEIESAECNAQLECWGRDHDATLVLIDARAGTDDRFHGAPGASWSWGPNPEDSESTQLLAGENQTLWENTREARQQIKDHWRDTWHGDPAKVCFDVISARQGAAALNDQYTDSGKHRAFINQRRANLNAENLQTSHGGPPYMLWTQRTGKANETFTGWTGQDVLRHCQANASGYDFLVGSTDTYPFVDNIHHNADGMVQGGVMAGLAQAYVLAYGLWEPYWITSATIQNGNTLVLTTNRPTARDEVAPEIRPPFDVNATSHGFSLFDASAFPTGGANIGSQITLGLPTWTNDVTIQVPITGDMTGVTAVEVGYAVRGSAQPDGTETTPSHSATWGDLTWRSKHHSKVGGHRIYTPLCSFVEIVQI
ncbi:MAG: hypothetical protein AAFY65_01380 [Pseudomonadota bacterium]